MADSLDELIWDATYKQQKCLELPFSIFECLFGGAVGGGKTDLIVIMPLAYQFHLHPMFKGLILRRTFPELEKEIIIRAERWYKAAGGVYNQQKSVWKFPSGARIFFGHAENERDIKNYDGVEWNYIGFDELTSFTEFQYLYLAATRARSSTPDLPAIVRASAMPGDIGNEWVRRRFVEPAINGSKIILDKVSGKKRIFIKSEPKDNKYLLLNNPDYLNQLALLPEHERRAKLGDWWIFAGQVFGDFRIEPLEGEPLNARHVIEPIHIPDWWPKILAIDWGYKANTVAYWGAISPDGRLYVYREYVVKETDVSDWATEIGELSRFDKNLKTVKLDTNAWDQRGEEETIAQQFENFSHLRPERASKGRVSGKMLVQEYLRWRQKKKPTVVDEYNDDYAQLIFKNKGMEAYKDYINRFAPIPDENNIPKLQIFNTCTELVRVLPLCVYDERTKEDVKEFEGDDAYDCIRYLVKGATSYLNESKNSFDHLRKEAAIVDRLEQTKDYTAYALARKLLAENAKGFGTRSFHRGRMRTVQTPYGITGSRT